MRTKIEFNNEQIAQAISLTKRLYRKEQDKTSNIKVKECQTMYSYLMPHLLFLKTRELGYDGSDMYDETCIYGIDKAGNSIDYAEKMKEQGSYMEFLQSLNEVEFKGGKMTLR